MVINKKPLAGRIILILEAESLVCTLLSDQLEDAGAITVWAKDVPEAVEELQLHSIDAAIVDLWIQQAERAVIVQALKVCGVPYVATSTTNEMVPDRAHAVFRKPYQIDDLIKALTAIFQAGSL